MSHRKRGQILIAVVAGCMVSAAVISYAQNNQATPGGHGGNLPAPVMDVKQLMHIFNKPFYTDLKKDLSNKPDSNDKWEDIEHDALQGAEIANLIAIRKVPPSAIPVVQRHAGELQHESLALAKAAKAKDYDQAQQSWKGLVQSCNSCHKALAPEKAPQLKP